jgi:hypothetical protein
MQNLNIATRKINIKRLILICLLITAAYNWKNIAHGMLDGMADAGLDFRTAAK